jgi:hypothetical protein
MSDWERAGGTPRWSKPPLLEALGELSIDSPGTRSIRGRGVVVAVAPDPSTGAGHLHWLIKKAFQSTPTTGWIEGNLIRGHHYDGSVLVVRYERLVVGFEQMQLAFRGAEAGQLAAVVTTFAAARTAVNDTIEMANAAHEDARRRASRKLDEHELAEARSMFGEIIRWDDPDDEARDDSQCSFAANVQTMAMRACLAQPSTTYEVNNLLVIATSSPRVKNGTSPATNLYSALGAFGRSSPIGAHRLIDSDRHIG